MSFCARYMKQGEFCGMFAKTGSSFEFISANVPSRLLAWSDMIPVELDTILRETESRSGSHIAFRSLHFLHRYRCRDFREACCRVIKAVREFGICHMSCQAVDCAAFTAMFCSNPTDPPSVRPATKGIVESIQERYHDSPAGWCQ